MIAYLQGWGPLCHFLGKEIPQVPFPCENQANSAHNITDKMLQDTWIARKMGREIKIILCLFLLCIALLIVIVVVLCLYLR